MLNRAVFLDRDGTIIKDSGYPSELGDLVLLPGAARAIAALNDLGVKVVVISNQSGVGRGFFSRKDVDNFNAALLDILKQQSARIDAFYYCPHTPGADGEPACDCRKPGSGLFRQAAEDMNIRLESSFMIGDRLSDIIAGTDAGCSTVLLAGALPPEPNIGCKPDHIAANLVDAVEWIATLNDQPLVDN